MVKKIISSYYNKMYAKTMTFSRIIINPFMNRTSNNELIGNLVNCVWGMNTQKISGCTERDKILYVMCSKLRMQSSVTLALKIKSYTQ